MDKEEEGGRKGKKGGRGKGDDEYNVMSYDIGDACGSRKMTIIRSLLNFFTEYPWKPNGAYPYKLFLDQGCLVILISSFRLSALNLVFGSRPLSPSPSFFFSLFFSSPINGNTQLVTRSAASRQLRLVPPVIALHPALAPRSSFWPNKFRTFRFWVVGRICKMR